VRREIGVVDAMSTEIKTEDSITRAIERAESVIGPGRIKYIHPDRGFWMFNHNIVDGKIRALIDGRNLYEACQVDHIA
jgi:5-methyltetrahydropteroyltriglutamate--homocysteine methyltransferase